MTMDFRENILINRVIRAARRFPDRPALLLPDSSFTYAELMARAGSVANRVSALHNRAPVVGILAERSIDAYVGILGALLAGKGYLPLNPRFPVQRNIFMIEKSGLTTLIMGRECVDYGKGLLEKVDGPLNIIVQDKESGSSLEGQVSHPFYYVEKNETFPLDELDQDPEATAYLLFTSGSTGSPKGVAVSNFNVTAYLDNLRSMFGFSEEDRFSQTFDLTFDLSVHDLFLCWSSGACLCIPEDNSTFGLSRYLRQMQPTVWFSVPSVATLMDRMRLLKEDAFPWIRKSFFCGEALRVETALSWKKAASASDVVNLYGPTETTIAVSSYLLPDNPGRIKSRNGIVSIGKPFPGHDGVIEGSGSTRGMLYIRGPQVVSGYFNDPELTRKSFSGERSPTRVYATGDLAERDEEGDLYFLGRMDSEVKISGYRVDLQEIDHILSVREDVQQAVTLYLPGSGENHVLVTFIVGHEDRHLVQKVLDHCRKLLPYYMVPEKLIFVEAVPLNPNGKTDRQALAEIFRNKHE